MVLVQKWPLFHFFVVGNIGQENVLYDILERKNVFLSYKDNKSKKSINWHFSKRVNPWFWSKNGHFCYFFFLGNIGRENVFYDILERENVFLSYKNKKTKESKNWDFFKGVTHVFGPKMAIFPFFCCRQYRPGKCLVWYSRMKKRLSKL